MHSLKLAPARQLAPFVAYLRVTQVPPERATSLPYLRLPDGQLELTVCTERARDALRVVGTRLRALRKPSHAAREFVTVRFKAGGAYPFFGLPLSELTDVLTNLDALWGDAASRLDDALRAAPSVEARVGAIEHALTRRLTSALYEPSSAPSVRRALRLVLAAPELPTVEALGQRLGASTRQLRRSFLDVVGIGPKQYLRVLRFQRALRAARRSPHASFVTIARDAGYYDQAHMITEFQALAGVTPSTLLPRARALRSTSSPDLGAALRATAPAPAPPIGRRAPHESARRSAP